MDKTADKREKCCGEWDSLAGRCTDCPHDKESTPRTDALIEEALKFADTPWAYTDEERKAFRKKLLMSHSQLERELAMMTEAHETCKRCFAEAERALSATLPNEAIDLLREALPFTIVNHPTAIALERRIVAFLNEHQYIGEKGE